MISALRATVFMNLKNICIVLVEPQGARNIGSVARAMANFAMSELRLVRPQTDHLQEEARQMAVKAGTILEQARLYADLQTALTDCHCVFGTTRRLGKYRVDILNPDDAALQMLPLLDSGRRRRRSISARSWSPSRPTTGCRR